MSGVPIQALAGDRFWHAAMAWYERALRQHWRWHRLRLLDLASGELGVVAGLAGRHVTGLAQRPDGGPLAVVSWDGPDYDPGVFTSRLHIADPRCRHAGRDRADGPFALVTLIHGGPYDRWADELMVSWVSWGQWLAAAGFAVFCPNPRGSQGHGREFAAMVAAAVGQR